MGVEVTEHHLVSTILQKALKLGSLFQEQEEAGGMYTLMKVNVICPRSISTVRTSAVSSSGSMSCQAPYRGRSGGRE